MTIYGWDASHYDAVPDAGRLVTEGFSFMTHKAGGDKADAELAAWWSAVRSRRGKLLLGAYWVLRPDLTSSPTAAADAFLARLDSQCPGWRDGPFILQADCEIWNGNAATKPNRAYIRAFCERLVAKVPKLRPIVYASAGQYGDSLTGLGYPLWNARYVLSYKTGTASALYAGSGGDSGKGWGTYSGQVPAIWQFTSSATIAGQTTCDANAYRGTLVQLTALVAPGWTNIEEGFMAGLNDQQQKDLAYQVKRCWWMVRNIESLVLAMAEGNSQRPKWADGETGYTYPAVPMFGNVSLGQLLADRVSDADLAEALRSLPTADDTARAVVEAIAAASPEQTAAALKVVLGDNAEAVGRLLAGA